MSSIGAIFICVLQTASRHPTSQGVLHHPNVPPDVVGVLPGHQHHRIALRGHVHVSVTRDRGGSADVVAGLAIVHALGVVVLQFDAFAQECGEDGGTAVVVAVLAAITAAEEDRR